MSVRIIPYGQLGKAGYNRPINRTHVNRIKREFNEDMVQPAIVSFRDGRYWIVDHQHQTQAIYELNGNDPNTPIRCDIRTGLTYEQEADLYYRLNTGSKPLSFRDKMMGLIESKDPTALDFRDTVESCGYVITDKNSRSFDALNAGWIMFNREGGKGRLTTILNLTHACWPNNKKGVHTDIIGGIAMFLDHHEGEYQKEHFVKVMSANDPSDIIKKATAFYKQMDSKSFTKPYCTYTEIINRYNYALRNRINAVAPGM